MFVPVDKSWRTELNQAEIWTLISAPSTVTVLSSRLRSRSVPGKGCAVPSQSIQRGWRERRGSDKLRTSLPEESHWMFPRNLTANSIVSKLPNGAINGFQSFSEYYRTGFPNAVLKHLTSQRLGDRPDSAAHLVELTPDSLGLPLLKYFLLRFIPGSGLQRHQHPQ